MLEHFSKYQSLGNDFILFDWFRKPAFLIDQTLNAPDFSATVAALCNRHTGVGADGVLILKEHRVHGCAQMLIFNADGTQAQLCMNGLRCVAHCLVTNHHFPETFNIETQAALVACSVTHDQENPAHLVITTKLDGAMLQGNVSLSIDGRMISGFIVDVGNPHFIIFEPTTLGWLTQHGASIERHEQFPNQTNVEFVWQHAEQEKSSYNVLVYERGCGITQACSSGAAAITWTLYEQGHCKTNVPITLCMPGGVVTCLIDGSNTINLQASAHKVFDGTLSSL